jgi:hypothetical protein
MYFYGPYDKADLFKFLYFHKYSQYSTARDNKDTDIYIGISYVELFSVWETSTTEKEGEIQKFSDVYTAL